jgi:hypothetical protein
MGRAEQRGSRQDSHIFALRAPGLKPLLCRLSFHGLKAVAFSVVLLRSTGVGALSYLTLFGLAKAMP